jgi:hypothetical protein
MKRAVTLGLAIVLTLGVAAGTTQANKKVKKFETAVTVDDLFGDDMANPAYVGHVSSDKARCERGRTVEVHRVDVNGTGEDEVQGTDKTDASGNWAVPHSGLILVADYYAVAEKKKIKKKHHRRLICKEGTSPVFDGPF